jgi:small GTP-binding protein
MTETARSAPHATIGWSFATRGTIDAILPSVLGHSSGEPGEGTQPPISAAASGGLRSGRGKAVSPGPDWARLERLAQMMAALDGFHADVATRAQRVAERISSQRFHIAVLGEFKRGKSTLVNALVGKPLLPSGSLPLTAVTTEVHIGSPETAVIFDDGRRIEIGPDAIGAYVTEAGNPSNRLGVGRVEVGVVTTFGVSGLVLVDTPGMASVNEHNTVAAHDALLDSDAAVVVLSADSPLSASERALLVELHERGSPLFIVINKADHLAPHDLDEVRAFVSEHVSRLVGETISPYCVSARAGLDAAASAQVSEAASSFVAFRSVIDAFVRDHLDAARYSAAVGELRRLGADLGSAVRIEEAAMAMDLHTLTDRLGRFETAAHEGRRLLEQDRVVLDHDVSELSATIGRELTEGAARAARDRVATLVSSASVLPLRQLEAGLADVVERSVTEGFDPVLHAAQKHAQGAWRILAERFASRVQARVDELRSAASHLFEVHLPDAAVPEVGDQRERFSYLFLHIEGPNAVVRRVARALIPSRLARRRALRQAQRKLVEEFDKHAGRARYDIAERFKSVEYRFVQLMTAEFEQTDASVTAAVVHAQESVGVALADQDRRRAIRDEVMIVLAEVATF